MSPFLEKLQADWGTLFGFVAVMWLLHLIGIALPGAKLNESLGLRARRGFSPLRIVFSTLLHWNWQHLISNTQVLLILGWLVMLPESSHFWIVTAVTMLVDGLGTFFFSRPGAITVGASGLVMGYFGFLLSRGFFSRDTGSVLFALALLIFYAWLIPQIWPRAERVSKTGHFWGFVGGILSAWVVTIWG